MRALAALCACAALPTSAFAQAGESSVAIAALPQDLSPWGMFLHADTIVKAVMIGLAVASLVTSTVWVAKSIELFGARAVVRRGLRVLAELTTLAQAHEKLRGGKGPRRNSCRRPRARFGFPRICAPTARRSASPALGAYRNGGGPEDFARFRHPRHDWRHRAIRWVFGTVWGIMDSFVGIRRRTQPIGGVAPASRGAPATALGLVAAIPAVMI